MLPQTGLERWFRIPQTQKRKKGMSAEETRTEAQRRFAFGKHGMPGMAKAKDDCRLIQKTC